MKMHMPKYALTAFLLLSTVLLRASGYTTLKQYEPEVNTRLQTAGLPQQLAFLPVLLTGCNNDWCGAAAAGAWALPDAAARHYGLAVSSSYDSRRDFLTCTDAAISYLKDLYSINKEDFEKTLSQYFRAARREDLACDCAKAAARLAELADQYSGLGELPESLEDVRLVKAVLVSDLCESIGEAPAVFYETNPMVVCGSLILPAGATVRIPEGSGTAFSKASSELYASAAAWEKGEASSYKAHRETVKPTTDVARPSRTVNQNKPQYTMYTVKKGDVLGKIAAKHHTTVQKIMKANALKSPDKIREGQKLKIPR